MHVLLGVLFIGLILTWHLQMWFSVQERFSDDITNLFSVSGRLGYCFLCIFVFVDMDT